MSRALTCFFMLAVVAALALRCPQLAIRPMHNDEAVNAIKLDRLWEHGFYHYDPQEYHGPTLIYGAFGWMKAIGATEFANFTEAELRFVTVIFGIGLIFLLPLVEEGLGTRATAVAALLTAISPAMVFYSRYFIHEMLLVFFTFLLMGAAWRYLRTRELRWALLAGTALALMQATKETFVLSVAAMVGGLIANALWERTQGQFARSIPRNYKHWLAAFGMWLLVLVVLFTSFFTNAAGPLDAIRTYMPWMHRAGGASPHIHPWNFYLERLLFFHVRKGPVWSEGLILVLGLIGMAAGFKRRGLAEGHGGFVRFIAFYTVMLTILYCAIGYKTTWCLLNFWHGMILLAGVGTVTLLSWFKTSRAKIAVGLVLGVFAGQLAYQAWAASVTYASSPVNPYVYAQTSPNILELVDRVNAISKWHPDRNQMVIKVMAPDSDFWPLPWYLRRFKLVGWWPEMPKDPFAPVMVVSAKFPNDLGSANTHIMVGLFELRPGVFFQLYVEKNLWNAYLKRPRDAENAAVE